MKNIKVTLSGSGFRFPAHVGALAAIEERDYRVVEMSATSGGAIVAAAYASGKSVSELKDITFNTDFSNMLEYNPLAILNYSFCNGTKLNSFVESLIGKSTTFGQLRIQLSIAASDITNSRIYVFKDREMFVAKAVRASTAVPFIYSPTIYDNRYLVDGGIIDNTPVDLLSDKHTVHDDDILKLGVKLSSEIQTTRVKSAVGIIGRIGTMLFDANDNAHIDSAKFKGALFSIVNTGTIGSFDSKMPLETRKQLFKLGYEKTQSVLSVYESETQGARSFADYISINKKIYG